MEHSVIDYIINSNEEMHKKIEITVNYQNILRRKNRVYEKLIDMLNEEQKELFDKYMDNEDEEQGEIREGYFKMGMKFGIRLVAESMFD